MTMTWNSAEEPKEKETARMTGPRLSQVLQDTRLDLLQLRRQFRPHFALDLLVFC